LEEDAELILTVTPGLKDPAVIAMEFVDFLNTPVKPTGIGQETVEENNVTQDEDIGTDNSFHIRNTIFIDFLLHINVVTVVEFLSEADQIQ